MSRTLQLLHRTRSLSFTVVLITLTAVVWLLCTDLMFRYPIGGTMLWHLKGQFGFWPAVDHSIRGLMGVYMVSKSAHWISVAMGLFLFFATQMVFIHPRRGWLTDMATPRPNRLLTDLCTALIAAWLTVGAAAIVLETLGYWSQLPGRGVTIAGFILQPSFWIAVPLFIVSWIFWSARIIRRHHVPPDGFREHCAILYAFFVVGGIELFIAGLLEANHGFVGQYWTHGTFTASEIGFTTILWTLAPATAMVYTIKPYTQHIAAHPPSPIA